jgi:hypothetical protein
MNKIIYIYHHLGLGDHIICNGIVRYFKQSYDVVYVFSKPHNYENLKYMYRDDNNIIILPIGEDYDVNLYIENNGLQDKVIRVGFDKLSSCGNQTFDECFYSTMNLDFKMRYDYFKLDRDINLEKEIYNKLNPDNTPYIFIHGNVDRNKIRNDLKIIENPIEYKIFDLLYLIENATEVHLMESSIKCLVNSMEFVKPKFYYHRYIRQYGDFLNSKGLNDFTIID